MCILHRFRDMATTGWQKSPFSFLHSRGEPFWISRWIWSAETRFLARSKNELIQWCGVRRLSVCLSVCPFVCKLLRKSLLLADKWPDRHQTFTRWTPGQRASIQDVLKVKVIHPKAKGHVIRALSLGFLEWATPSLTVWFRYPISQDLDDLSLCRFDTIHTAVWRTDERTDGRTYLPCAASTALEYIKRCCRSVKKTVVYCTFNPINWHNS